MHRTVPRLLLDQPPTSRRAFLASALLHVSALFLVVRFPVILASRIFPDRGPAETYIRSRDIPLIYYDLKTSSLPPLLPAIQSAGADGGPGRLQAPAMAAATGAGSPVTIVIKHPQADNDRQRIVQPLSPPRVKIQSEIRLPDIVVTAPVLTAKPVPEPMIVKPAPAPKLAWANAPLAAPQISTAASTSSGLAQLSLPAPAAASARLGAIIELSAGAASNSATQNAGDPTGLVVVSANPGPNVDVVALPLGNRWGGFSVSPAAVRLDSAGSASGNTASGTQGAGGNGSLGGSPGSGLAGGGASGDGGSIAIAGGSAELAGIMPENLAPAVIAGNIFPVVAPPPVRRDTFLVYAGPAGGGGLDVYGALRGGKIYTAFLRMPGKNWILQYCLEGAQESPPLKQRGNQVRFGETIAPPDAIEQFDFRRTAVAAESRGKLIVLRGRIDKDGQIAGLKVYRGVRADLDAMALAAFQRWKFTPALRAGQPAAVQVLVGIPVNK